MPSAGRALTSPSKLAWNGASKSWGSEVSYERAKHAPRPPRRMLGRRLPVLGVCAASRPGHADGQQRLRQFSVLHMSIQSALRVLRGGGWFDCDASDVRAAYRGRGEPRSRAGFVGFRCAI